MLHYLCPLSDVCSVLCVPFISDLRVTVLPKGRMCSLVNQVYTSFLLASLSHLWNKQILSSRCLQQFLSQPFQKRRYLCLLWNKQIFPFRCLKHCLSRPFLKMVYMHTCEISRYFHFAVCSGAPLWMFTRSRQHEVLTRAEWILASTQHLTDIESVSACNRRQQFHYQTICYWTQPSKHEALNQCWFDAGSASQTVGQHWTSNGPALVNVLCLLGVLTNHIVFRHRRGSSLYCPQEPFITINYKSHWRYIWPFWLVA